MAVDPIKLAVADKSVALPIVEAPSNVKCCICDAFIEAWEWIVRIPRIGTAHPHCAGDHGWQTR